jgi:hypothetical protein
LNSDSGQPSGRFTIEFTIPVRYFLLQRAAARIQGRRAEETRRRDTHKPIFLSVCFTGG